jgi:hypothetical protein
MTGKGRFAFPLHPRLPMTTWLRQKWSAALLRRFAAGSILANSNLSLPLIQPLVILNSELLYGLNICKILSA